MEFGYLPKSDIETGNLRTEEQLKEAIKNLQVRKIYSFAFLSILVMNIKTRF